MNSIIKKVLKYFGVNFGLSVNQHYKAECYDKAGNLKWVEEFDNMVVDSGLDEYLGVTLKGGTQHSSWYVGLKDTGTVVEGDTLASHGGWAELTSTVYSGNRPAYTPGAIGNGSSGRKVDNSASKASFTITGADTIYGAMLCDVNTGNTGILLGAGDFSSPRTVAIDDVLNITVTCELSAA